MTRYPVLAILLAASASAAPEEVWLTKERAAQLKSVTSRPYITAKAEIAPGLDELRWTNGSRSWATTQAVRRIVGARARDLLAELRNEAQEARKERDALLEDVRELAGRPKVTPADLKAAAEKHGAKPGSGDGK